MTTTNFIDSLPSLPETIACTQHDWCRGHYADEHEACMSYDEVVFQFAAGGVEDSRNEPTPVLLGKFQDEKVAGVTVSLYFEREYTGDQLKDLASELRHLADVIDAYQP